MVPGPAASFHLAAYYGLDAAAAVDEDIPAVANDGVLTRQNNHYWAQQDMKLMCAYARNNGILRAKINTPNFRSVSTPYIVPVHRGTAPITLVPYSWYEPSDITIPRLDEVAMLFTNDGAGGVAAFGGLWLEDPRHNKNVPQGDAYTIRATTTITTVLGQWVGGNLAFEQVLPSGTYTIVGMYATGATTEFMRLTFQGGGWKPGIIVAPTVAIQPWRDFLKGNSGIFGSFNNTAPPAVEVLGNAAAAITYNVYFDVIRTGPA